MTGSYFQPIKSNKTTTADKYLQYLYGITITFDCVIHANTLPNVSEAEVKKLQPLGDEGISGGKIVC